jgi:hypothetical protein
MFSTTASRKEQEHQCVVFAAGLGGQFVEPVEVEPDRDDADCGAVAVDDRQCNHIERPAGDPDEKVANHELAFLHRTSKMLARGEVGTDHAGHGRAHHMAVGAEHPNGAFPGAVAAHPLEERSAGVGRARDNFRDLRDHLKQHARFGDDPLIAFRDAPGAVDGVGVRCLDAGLALAVEAHAHRAHERQRNEQDHPEQTDADPAEKRARRPVASDPPCHGSPLLCRPRLEDNLCGAIKQIRLRRVNRGLWLPIAYRDGRKGGGATKPHRPYRNRGNPSFPDGNFSPDRCFTAKLGYRLYFRM